MRARARAARRREPRQGPSLFLLPPPPASAPPRSPVPPDAAQPRPAHARRPRPGRARPPLPPSPARCAAPCGRARAAGWASASPQGRLSAALHAVGGFLPPGLPQRGAAEVSFYSQGGGFLLRPPTPRSPPDALMRRCHPRLLPLRTLGGRRPPTLVTECSATSKWRVLAPRGQPLWTPGGRPGAAVHRYLQLRVLPGRYPPLPSQRARPECASPLSGDQSGGGGSRRY